MTIAIDQERLSSITHLYPGRHDAGSSEMCVMEAVAFVTHKKWTDDPPCVCPILGEFMRAWNDGLPDDKRTALLMPFIPRLLNTKGSKQLEQRRAVMVADWLIRTHTPASLRFAKARAAARAAAIDAAWTAGRAAARNALNDDCKQLSEVELVNRMIDLSEEDAR